MGDTQLGWDDQLGHLSPDGIVSSVAERPRGRRVELDDASTVIHRDDTVERGVERGFVPLRDGLAGGLGALPLDELPQLHSEQLERIDKICVNVKRLVAEQLDHADESALAADGETGGRVQAGVGRGLVAWQLRVGGEVADPLRPAGEPHASREALAGVQRPSRWPARHRAPGRSARPSAGTHALRARAQARGSRRTRGWR